MNEKVKAIRGDRRRAEEVKQWLKNNGAIDLKNLSCDNENWIYFVKPNGEATNLMSEEFYFLFDIKELPRWRAENNKTYLYIDDEMGIYEDSDCRGSVSDNRYENGNYFRTREEAEEMRDKIIKLLKSRSNE